MTREIKFRAWWPGDKTMESWNDILDSSSPVVMRLYFHTDDEFPVILMQFTGLKDKNGREIYEGDIVEVCEHPDESKTTRKVYKVLWMGPDYPAFDLDGWDGESNALAEIEQSGEWDIEVIGDIYENPALLQ